MEVYKMHKFEDCSFCGGEVKNDSVELDYRVKGKLYIFQNVPAGVCQQCGEKYLTAETSKKIEKRINNKQNWNRTIPIPVDNFLKKATV